MAGQTCTQQGVSCANPDYFNAAGFADKKEPGTATVGNCCKVIMWAAWQNGKCEATEHASKDAQDPERTDAWNQAYDNQKAKCEIRIEDSILKCSDSTREQWENCMNIPDFEMNSWNGLQNYFTCKLTAGAASDDEERARLLRCTKSATA